MSRLLICCELDLPSVNMGKCLREAFDWEDLGSDGRNSYAVRDGDVMMTIPDLHISSENIDGTAKQFGVDVDEVVFMSKHKAASGIPTLTVHPIGNYKDAQFGGRVGTLVNSAPRSMTATLRFIDSYNDTGVYKASFEVTHHGPFLEKPAYFIEIGSDETHWGDTHAAEILSKAIADSEPDERDIVAIGVGGGHYAPRFTEVSMQYRISFGHMVPGYQMDGMDDETIVDYIRKASEATGGTKCVYLHKKAMKKSEERRLTDLISGEGYEVLSSKDLESISGN